MKRLVSILLVLLLVSLGAEVLCAQTSKGTIAGTITDPTGAVVPNAEVTAKDTLGGGTRTVKTGTSGEYRIEALNPSIYQVSIKAESFATKLIQDLTVSASVVTSLNASLTIGSVTTTIEVQEAALMVQSDNAELNKTISTKEVAELPISSLNPIQLVLTEPGAVSVQSRDDMTNGYSFATNGLRPRANNFLIDGFDNNDNGIAGQALQPQNLQAISEVAVKTNSYAAEFGRGGASVTNVIYKNGTNQFHGAAWERYSGNALDAMTAEQHAQGLTRVPWYVENVFGFLASGPVVKNKLFLLGSSQWDHLNGAEEGALLVIPTAAGVTALKSISSNPNVNTLLNSLGGLTAPSASGTINVGNRPGCGSPCLVEVGNLIRTPGSLSRAYEYVIRGDYAATDKDTYSARYIGTHGSLTPDLFANSAALPSVDSQQGGPARNLGAFWTHVYSPKAINEFRFTAQQIHFTFGPLAATDANPLSALPAITVSGLATFGGLNSALPQGRGHDVYEYQDAFSLVSGAHSIKIGADLSHLGVSDQIPFNSRGTVSFVKGGDCSAIGLASCTALANFIDDFSGPAGSAGKQFGSQFVGFAQTQQAYYFQDVWKLLPNLTLDYGLRYEYQGTPLNGLPYPTVNVATAATDSILLRVLQQPDRNNFGPRAGIAYSPRVWKGLFGEGKTVIRAGGGVFYDALFANIQDNAASSAPNVLGGTLTAPATGRGMASALEQVPAVTASLNPKAAVTVVASNLVNPLTYQWNVNLERELPAGFLATIAYVGTRGERLYLNQQLNPGVNGVRINPDRGGIGARTNLGNSIYHGLQVDVNRRFQHGFLLRGAYTWSHSIDTGSEVFTTSGGSSYSQDLFNVGLERGNSAFDRRQRAVITWVYEIPYFKSSSGFSGVASQIVRNWSVSGTASFETGAPQTVYFYGYDQNGDLSATNDRPDMGNPAAPINYSSSCMSSTTCITGVGQLMPDGTLVDFNTGASGTFNQFRYIATNGTNGNVGRNTLRNPGRQDYTLAVSRRIVFRERHSLELRAEAFNPFNHANAGVGAYGISGDILDSNFLAVDPTIAGGRSVRLWLKYSF